MSEMQTREVWKAVLGELQLQVPKPMFETWLKRTTGVRYDEEVFVVGAPTPFAVEWLERRMYHAIQTIVQKVTRMPLEVRFQVLGGAGVNDDEGEDWQDQPAEALGSRPGEYATGSKYSISSGCV